MFDPKALEIYAVQNPVEAITHLVAYASGAVAGLSVFERFLRAFQGWSTKWFPTLPLASWIGRVEYGVAAAADLIEIIALNWRAPKLEKRDVWDDAKRQEQLGQQSLPASAGK